MFLFLADEKKGGQGSGLGLGAPAMDVREELGQRIMPRLLPVSSRVAFS